MVDEKINGLRAIFDSEYVTLSLTLNTWLLITILVIIFAAWLIKFFITRSRKKLKLTTVTLNIAGQKLNFNIERNYLNLEIAHKIYIELVTRKAAIPIDEDKDIISEIYDSWYVLFCTTREEIKSIKGELLEHPTSETLISMVTGVLNKGLRPHLTTYQGRFRRWYELELKKDENKGLSPQLMQKKFSDYDELILSIKQVNELLIEYADELKRFIYS